MPRLPEPIERIQGVYTTPAPRPHTEPRIGLLPEIVRRLSLYGKTAGKVELMNAVMLAMVDLIYESDGNNEYANVDVGGRILVPMPWGRIGREKWQNVLRVTEANCLRHIMLQRAEREGVDALLRYDAESKSWYINKPLKRHAADYLLRNPITKKEWRAAWGATGSAWRDENLSDDVSKG